MPMSSPFDALIDDLIAVQQQRATQTPSRDTASRSARHAAEAQRNRRMTRPQPQRRLAKAAAILPAPNFEAIAARQDKIAADLEQTRIQAQRDAIREHLRTLRAAAKAGRLTAHQACLLDVYRGQAAAMGLQP